MLKIRPFYGLLTLGILIWPGTMFGTSSFAQPLVSLRRSTPRVLFKPPASNKKPDRTIGAGVRQGTSCHKKTTTSLTESAASKTPLMALVPTPVAGGLTLTERPSFWVYVPATNAKQVMISLKEEGVNVHSQTFFPVQNDSGLKQFTLPQNVPPLALNKTYQWAAVLVCGQRPGPNDPMVTAWIRRVALPSSARGTTLERTAWLAEQGIWYDALSEMAKTQTERANDQEFRGIWLDFLRSAGLEPIPTEMVQLSALVLP